MQVVVGGIVKIARASPLAGIVNLSELKKALDDPDAVFEFYAACEHVGLNMP